MSRTRTTATDDNDYWGNDDDEELELDDDTLTTTTVCITKTTPTTTTPSTTPTDYDDGHNDNCNCGGNDGRDDCDGGDVFVRKERGRTCGQGMSTVDGVLFTCTRERRVACRLMNCCLLVMFRLDTRSVEKNL